MSGLGSHDHNWHLPPCFRWFPVKSWPVSIFPPTEVSLDEVSWNALLGVLGLESPLGERTPCYAYWCDVMSNESDPPRVFETTLDQVSGLINPEAGRGASPSNLWRIDRSWFVWTDWDLWGTKISGSLSLMARLEADPDLEVTTWQQPSPP